MSTVQVRLLEFVLEGATMRPRDAGLYEWAARWSEGQFGEVPEFSKNYKTWVVVKVSDVGQIESVLALGSTRLTVDVPIFHVSPPSGPTDEERFDVIRARDALYGRMRAYLEDNGAKGNPALIYVAPEAQRIWAKYLKRIGAKAANRFEVEV